MKEILTRKEAADYLKISVSLLESLATRGMGPKFFKFGSRSCRYATEDLNQWIQSRRTHKSIR
jgi:predicted DNA-binding transcriptional regulator AlpA